MPCPVLLRDHFHQCIYANVRGSGARDDKMWDGDEDFDLQDIEAWASASGKARIELELANRLVPYVIDV